MADRTVASAAADLRLVDTKIPSDIAAAKRKLLAELRKIEQEAKIRVGVSFDAATANRDLARFRTQLKDVSIKLGVDTKAAISELQTFNAQVSEADRDDINVRVDVDNLTESTAQLQLFGALADEVDGDDINVRMDVDGAPQAIAQVAALKAATSDVNRQERSGAGLAGAFAGIAGLIAPIGLVGAAIGAIGVGISVFGVKASADIEQTIAAFENLLGSAEAANELFSEIQDLADISPFETQTLANATKSLLAIGVATEDVIPTVENLAGIVSLLGGASSESFGRLTLALGQVRSSMKPMTVDLYQIQNALPGFNAKLQLATGVAEEFGISNEEALAKIEDGAITGEEAYDILIQRMAEFPGAATAIAAQAETLQGKLSTFTDVVKRSLVDSFLPITQLIKDELPGITTATQEALDDIAPALGRSFEKLIPRIVPLIETLGESLAPAFEGVFTALGSALEGITPILEELGPIIGDIFPILGEIVATLGPAVADAAGALGGALVPALQAFADVLNDIPVPVLTAVIEGIIALTVASKVAGGVTELGKAMGLLGKSATIGFGPIGLAAAAITGLLVVLGNRAEAQQKIDDTTAVAVDALTELTAAFEENAGAVSSAASKGEAAALAYERLGAAILAIPELGENVVAGLNAIGVLPGPEAAIEVLGQIGAFGDPNGNVANVPEIMTQLRKAFGDQAPAVAKLISENDHLDDTFDQLYNDGLRLTDGQKGLIEQIELLQDASEDVDIAAITTQFLQGTAAQTPFQEKLLATAESLTGISRFTTDAADATELYEKRAELLAETLGNVGGETNRFREMRDAVAEIGPEFDTVNDAVAELGQVTEDEMGRAEQAVEDLDAAIAALQGRLDTTIATQNFMADLRNLPKEFAADLDATEEDPNGPDNLVKSVVDLVREQAAFSGLTLADFLVQAPTDESLRVFQEFVAPLVEQGTTEFTNAMRTQGADAAIQVAQETRLRVIAALIEGGLDEATAIELASSLLPQSEIERLAAETGVNAGTILVEELEGSLEDTTFTARVNADTAEAKIAIQGLSNEQVNVLVGADVSAALNAIESLSGRTAFINIQTSVQGDPELGRLERQLNRDLNGNGIIGRKDGGILEFFRNGGFGAGLTPEQHYAQIAPAGAWRVWAEPETGGEAYIPLARQKRDRSEKILTTVADLFGMDVVARPSASAVAQAAYGFGDSGRGGGTAVLTREDVRTMARDIAEEVVAAMPAPVTVEHHPAGYSDPSAMAEIIYAKLNRKVRRR